MRPPSEAGGALLQQRYMTPYRSARPAPSVPWEIHKNLTAPLEALMVMKYNERFFFFFKTHETIKITEDSGKMTSSPHGEAVMLPGL